MPILLSIILFLNIVYSQDVNFYLDECNKTQGCSNLVNQYICKDLLKIYLEQEYNNLSYLQQLSNIEIKTGQKCFLKDFIISKDLFNYLKFKIKNGCKVQIDYLLNSCPILMNYDDKSKLEYYSFVCMRFKEAQYLNFKECLQDDIQESFNIEYGKSSSSNQEIEVTICYKGTNHKVIEDFKRLTQKLIIEQVGPKQQIDKLKMSFKKAQVVFNQGFCSESCQICKDFQQCETCKEGYKLHKDHGHCHEIECEQSEVLFQGKCQQNCPEGYVKQGKICISCTDNCQECLNEPLECNKCKQGFFLQNKTCKKCPQNCLNCQDTNKCTQCNDNYKLNEGSCIKDCKDGEYANNDICVQCNSNCKQCLGEGSQKCIKCKDNFYLKGNGECESECSSNQFKDLINLKCIDCHPNCNECQGPSEKECKNCTNKDYICEFSDSQDNSLGNPSQMKHCIKSNIYNCRMCQNQDLCIECGDKFKYDQGSKQCLNISKQCSNGCESCTINQGEQKCYSCQENLFLDENALKCLQICPNGYYGDKLNRKCLKCFEQCLNCTGPSQENCQDKIKDNYLEVIIPFLALCISTVFDYFQDFQYLNKIIQYLKPTIAQFISMMKSLRPSSQQASQQQRSNNDSEGFSLLQSANERELEAGYPIDQNNDGQEND